MELLSTCILMIICQAHFHAEYNDYEAMLEIETAEIIRGSLPSKQLKYVQVWADIHKNELLRNFEFMRSGSGEYFKIKPL